MSYWVAGAAIGSAVIGAVSSNNAANKSASAAEKGTKSTTDIMNQSRTDAVNLFNQGKQSRMLGQNAAFDFYKQNAQNISRPMVQGNMMAQQVQGQGGIQANNAILGLPVDMSFANNPQQISADYSSINNAQLPVLGNGYNAGVPGNTAQTQTNAQNGQYQSSGNNALTLGGNVVHPIDMLNLVTQLTNPLGLGEKYQDPLTKKLSSVASKDPVTKALRGLFR